jgi:Tetracyclin repressor-like, C-terminal domain
MVQSTGAVDTGSLRGDLEAIQRSYSKMAENPAARSMFVWMVSRSMDDPEFARAFRKVRNQPRGPTVIAFQRAIARGEISADTDVDLAFHLFQGPFLSKRIIDNEVMDEPEFQRMLDLMMRAFTSP